MSRLLFDRRLRDPRMVPTVPVRVNWGHPLAQGLIGLYLPAIYGNLNLAGGAFPSLGILAGTPVAGALAGPSLAGGSAYGAVSAPIGGVYPASQGFSSVWVGTLRPQGSSQLSHLLGVDPPTNTAPYGYCSIENGNGGTDQYHALFSSGGAFATTAYWPPPAFNAPYVMAAVASATEGQFWANGVLEGTVVQSLDSIAATAVTVIGQRAGSIGSYYSNSQTSACFLFAVNLSPSSMEEISDAPFSMLEHAGPLGAFWWVGGSGTALLAYFSEAQTNALVAAAENDAHGVLGAFASPSLSADAANLSQAALSRIATNKLVAAGANRAHATVAQGASAALSTYATLRLQAAVDEAASAVVLDATARLDLLAALNETLASGSLAADGVVATASILLAALDQAMPPGALAAAARVALQAALTEAAADIAGGAGQVRTWPGSQLRRIVLPPDPPPERPFPISLIARPSP